MISVQASRLHYGRYYVFVANNNKRDFGPEKTCQVFAPSLKK
jgi:hypothetical protein